MRDGRFLEKASEDGRYYIPTLRRATWRQSPLIAYAFFLPPCSPCPRWFKFFAASLLRGSIPFFFVFLVPSWFKFFAPSRFPCPIFLLPSAGSVLHSPVVKTVTTGLPPRKPWEAEVRPFVADKISCPSTEIRFTSDRSRFIPRINGRGNIRSRRPSLFETPLPRPVILKP